MQSCSPCIERIPASRERIHIMRRVGFLFLLPLGAAAPAHAQPPPAPAAGDPTTSATTSASTPADDSAQEAPAKSAGVLAVQVQAKGYDVDERSVRIAIAKELGVPVTEDASAAKNIASVSVTEGGDMIVSLKSQDKPEVLRVVKAPGRADEVPEVAALLVGNMARDESGELLASLRQPTEPDPKPAEPQEPTPPEEPKPSVPPAESKSKPDNADEQTAPKAPLPRRTANFSLFHPISTLKHSERYQVNIEAGLVYGRVGALQGIALNLLGVTQVDGYAEGVELSNFGNLNRGGGQGFRFAELFNIDLGRFDGAQLSGLFNSRSGGIGADVSGLVNHSDADLEGVQLSGIASVQRGELGGAQLSGIASFTTDSISGGQLSGISSVSQGDVSGAQLSGVASVAKDVQGMQFGSLANIAGDVSGLQLGLVNVGARVSGVQLGLVNIAEEVDGASVGLITYSQSGKVQWVNWVSSTQMLNTGVRFYTGPLYAMPTFGFQPRSTGPDVFAPGFSLGARLPLSPFYADLDANYSNPSLEFDFSEHLIDLRYRALLGLELTEWLGVFAGGGARQRLVTQGDGSQFSEAEFSAGIEFF